MKEKINFSRTKMFLVFFFDKEDINHSRKCRTPLKKSQKKLAQKSQNSLVHFSSFLFRLYIEVKLKFIFEISNFLFNTLGSINEE